MAAAVGVLVKILVFPYESWNADEGVYLAQADALRAGQLTWPSAVHQDFFRPWMTGEYDGHYFTKYLPGYPALLALAQLLTGTSVFVPALGAALLVLGSYALAYELFASRRAAFLAGGFVLCSPLLVVYSGLYLTYAVTTGLLFGAVALLVRGARLGSRVLLTSGGALAGVALLFRQYDVLLVGLPVATYLLARHGRPARRIPGLVGWPVLGTVPALATILTYNAAVTGSPLRLPLPATDPLDTLGFGQRRLLPGQALRSFTPEQAVEALLAHLAEVPDWVFGGWVLLLAAVAPVIGGRRRLPERLLLAGLVVAVPLGYFFFWGSMLATALGLSRLGPFYYTPALTALAVLAASGADVTLSRLAAWRGAGGRLRKAAFGGTAVVTAAIVTATVVTFASTTEKLQAQAFFTARAEAILAGIPPESQLQTPAVIVVSTPDGDSYAGQTYPIFRPGADLSAPVLYAASQGAADFRIFSLLPDRTVYGLRLAQARDDVVIRQPAAQLVRLTSVRGASLLLRTAVKAPTEGTCLTAFASLGDRMVSRPLTCSPERGQILPVAWVLGPGGDLPLPEAGQAVHLLTGVTAGPAGSTPDTPGGQVWEDVHSLGVVSRPEGPRAELVLPGESWHRRAVGSGDVWERDATGGILHTTAEPLPVRRAR